MQNLTLKNFKNSLPLCTFDDLKALRPLSVAVKAQSLYNSLFKKPFGEEIYITKAQQTNAARMIQEVKEKTALEDVVKVYPNPANNELFFILNNAESTENLQVNIYNVNGSLVMHAKLDNTNEAQKIDLQEFVSGIYFYQILSNSTLIKASKVVIMK